MPRARRNWEGLPLVVSQAIDGWRRIMSDYRNPDFRDPNDPLRRDTRYHEDARSANSAWGWIAGAVFVVVVLAVAFGIGHTSNQNTNTASNDTTPPAATRMAPSPGLAPPPNMAPPANGPASPTYTPGPRSTTQPQ